MYMFNMLYDYGRRDVNINQNLFSLAFRKTEIKFCFRICEPRLKYTILT